MENELQILQRIKDNINRVIVGKDQAITFILISLLCKGHVLIEDVPGVGKTSLVSSLARSLDCSFKRIQFTPDVLPSDITGFTLTNFKTGEFEFHPGLIMSQIILADEINRTSPKTQSSLLEVMEENQVTVDGVTHLVPQPFMVLATQNPIEYVGTYPLPEAQLDRFFMRISIGYPNIEEEMDILSRFQSANPLKELEPVACSNDILSLQDAVSEVYCSDGIKEYIARIVSFTRDHSDLSLGVSPRGGIFLLKASQAFALLQGRQYVIPDDIQKMVLPVLQHRIVLKPEARLKEITGEKVLQSILKSIRVPVMNL